MTPQRKTSHPLRTFPWRYVASALLAALLLTVARPALTDDRELLRTQTAKPFVFIILDTSASMAMKMGEEQVWAPGGADGPDSRLYQAKQALFNVFSDVQDVQFGFASYKQDGVYARAKHWLYYHTEDAPDSWPITFPLAEPTADPDLSHPNLLDYPDAEPDGSLLTQIVRIPEVDQNGNPVPTVDENGDPLPLDDPDTRVGEVSGDLLTFGPSFVDPADGSDVRIAGSCNAPLDLDDSVGRQRAQTFAIDGLSLAIGGPTKLWVAEGGSTYLLQIDRPGKVVDGTDEVDNAAIGEDNMQVKMEIWQVANCSLFDLSALPVRDASWNVKLRLDPFLNQTFFVDGDIGDGSRGNTEETAGLWPFMDTFSSADHSTAAPFTGEGWESNYDSGVITGDATFDANVTDTDPICFTDPLGNEVCSEVKPVSETVVSSLGRAMDKGDVLPFDWDNSQRSLILRRLAPNTIASSSPDFRTASYFEDDANSVGFLPLRNATVIPLLAHDLSPFAGVLTDVRCWYLGQGAQQGNRARKCNGTPFFEEGWEELACANDSEFGCRRPYFIIVGDGEQSGGGSSQDATASLSDLDNDNTKIWAINLGPERGCSSGGGLHPVVQTAKGECLTVSTGTQLRQTLQQILGLIRTEARSFASAAVPTVQAAVEQKIFLTNFTPLNDSGTWDGHLLSFLKPLPTLDGRPNTDILCSDLAGDPDAPPSQCFLWDAGAIIQDLQYDADASDGFDPLSESDGNLRRVYYSERATGPGAWADNRRLFEPLALVASNQERRFDLWRGMGLSFVTNEDDGDGDPSTIAPVNQLASDTANAVVDYTLSVKDGTLLTQDDNGDPLSVPISFLLGDTFHSTPQVVGTPANPFYYASDLYGDDSLECKTDDTAANANKGYRCFFERQRFRRKMLIVGANDGQLHVFDAGRFRTSGNDHFTDVALQDNNPDTPGNDFGSFDNGTGKELFSYVPRQVLPTLREQEDARSQHRFSVDGDVVVADVFIDPVADDATFPDPADRLWRTVAVGGLREGGKGYYALDITQPDPVDTDADLGFVPVVSGDNDPARGDYLQGCVTTATSGCGPVPFPSTVWEFTDTVWDPDNEVWFFADEDVDVLGNGACNGSDPDPSCGVHDLGDSWSTPNLGRIRVCKAGGTACNPVVGLDDTVDDDLIDVFVAVFAGGMDVESKSDPESELRGNWLYMVDIETGQPIYKQRLTGAAPADVAAVDTNSDSYLDRIYIGTLAGLMYRVDLSPLPSGELPALEDVEFHAIHPDFGEDTFTQSRIPRDVWQPVVIFDANYEGSDPLPDGVHRSIYHRPSVIFRAAAGNYALAFGTGDREDLWTTRDTRERFYVFVDPFDSVDDVVTELRESDFQQIDPAVDPVEQNANFLLTEGGWYFVLADNERVITESFALSGLTIFSTFIPEVIDDATGAEINIGCGDLGSPGNQNDSFAVSCSKQGNSNNYVVETTSGNGLLFEGDQRLRYDTVGNFVTNPFTEQSQTKRARRDSAGDSADDLSENMQKVLEALKELFPPQCKFGNYRLDVKTIAADTSVQMIAPVPVCIIQTNWKEF